MSDQELPIMTSKERLEAYELITAGCQHIWSKNKIQQEKAQKALESLVNLAYQDPYFLAHLTSYIMKSSKSNDLRVFLAYVSMLSSADGQPFSPGSEYKKPNLRYIGAAALHMLEPKLADRVALLSRTKFSVPNRLGEATHSPTALKEALKKYIQYRELHPDFLSGIKKAGLGNVFCRLAKKIHYNLSDDAREILNYPRRGQKFEKKPGLFEGLEDLAIAEKIRSEKLPYIGVLGELAKVNKKISKVIAVAMLEQATGNQAVIMRSTFEDAGLLKDKEVMDLYTQKISEAKTALDRVDAMSATASAAVKKAMVSARAENRKSEIGNIGKVFIHLDLSGSMERARDFACDKGSIIAEMVPNPKENFSWGWFSLNKEVLPVPEEFVKDAFRSVLFGKGEFGGTDCLALYEDARKFGADVDVFITDQGHGAGEMLPRMIRLHSNHPEYVKPKACLIIHFSNGWGTGEDGDVKKAYEALGIPVAVMKPEALSESALVVEAVRTAIAGPISTIDTIMDTELLALPNYYYSI